MLGTGSMPSSHLNRAFLDSVSWKATSPLIPGELDFALLLVYLGVSSGYHLHSLACSCNASTDFFPHETL